MTNQGDATHPGDGNWSIGTAAAGVVIVSGTYDSVVPSGSDCTWVRIALNHTIIMTGHADSGQRATVTVAATDGLFNTHGCGEWTRTG